MGRKYIKWAKRKHQRTENKGNLWSQDLGGVGKRLYFLQWGWFVGHSVLWPVLSGSETSRDAGEGMSGLRDLQNWLSLGFLRP